MQFPKESFQFLKKLIKNNNREWFNEHKPQYLKVQEKNKEFFSSIAHQLEEIDKLEHMKIYRIYRDVRFSKNKTPYKSTYSARFYRLGEERRGSFYIQIQPGKTFVAAGFYQPEKEDLYRIRKEFEYDADPIRKILSSSKVKQLFGGELQGAELKTAPRDFDKQDENIDLIRKKAFYLERTFTDKEILHEDFSQAIITSFRETLPFLNYMSEVLTTNLNGESLL